MKKTIEPKHKEEDIVFANNVLMKMQFASEAITLANQYIDINSIIEARLLLNEAGVVFFTGDGCSGRIASCGGIRMSQAKIPNKNIYVIGESTNPAVKKGDVVIIISTSGNTLVESIKKYKKIGAKIILMSAYKRSPLGRMAMVFIHIPDKKQIIKDNPVFARKIATCNNWEILGSLTETIAHIFINELIGEWGYEHQKTEIDFDLEHHTKQ